MVNKLSVWLKEISIPVFVLVCFFAISSWIDINGIWVEVPLLVEQLPESWDLPSYLVILIQIANIGPLLFTLAKKLAPERTKEWLVVYVIIGIGIAACILLVFLWNWTSVVGGVEHSTALLTLSMFLSIVDCTSSVVFLPYMAEFKPQYLTAFYIGEGLSGLLPAIIGLIQGVGSDPICTNETISSNGTESFQILPYYKPPNFSVDVYFAILAGLLCVSLVSFTILHFHPYCQERGLVCPRTSSNQVVPEMDYNREPDASKRRISINSTLWMSDEKSPIKSEIVQSERSMKNLKSILMLGLICLMNALTNGVLPSLQSYSCLPYGNLAYSLAVKLSVLANPVAAFFALFFQVQSVVGLSILTGFGTAFSVYHIVLAALSPFPPLYDDDAGIALAVVTFVALTAIFSYVKVCIACSLSQTAGADGLLWCGGITQVGSFVGAIITFVLVNVLHLFTSKYPCT